MLSLSDALPSILQQSPGSSVETTIYVASKTQAASMAGAGAGIFIPNNDCNRQGPHRAAPFYSGRMSGRHPVEFAELRTAWQQQFH